MKISFYVLFILSAFSENKRRVYGEYGKFRAVCGTQNCLRIRGNNVYVVGEDAKILFLYKMGCVRHVTGTGSGLLGEIPRVVVQMSALTLKGPL